MSDEWLEKFAEFSITFFETIKYHCLMKTSKIFSCILLILINNYIHNRNHIINNNEHFLYFSRAVLINIFVNIISINWIFNKIFWITFWPVFSSFLISNWFFGSLGYFLNKTPLSISSWSNLVEHLVFLI